MKCLSAQKRNTASAASLLRSSGSGGNVGEPGWEHIFQTFMDNVMDSVSSHGRIWGKDKTLTADV